MFKTKHIFALMLSGLLLGGCTEKLVSTPNAESHNGQDGVFKLATMHDHATADYIVDPPDEIVIKCPNIKEIDGNKQVVRPDGKVSFNLIGEIKVAGLTGAQVQRALQEAASKYYVNPDIKVEITAASKFFHIVGRGANKGGKVVYTGNDSIVKALTEGGLNQEAWPQQILLTRPEAPGRPAAVAVIDFKKICETGKMDQNYLIEVNDIIDVRDSPLSSFNFKASQVLGPISGGLSTASGARSAGTGN
jgi:polysaccharide biosynthesis/export protein